MQKRAQPFEGRIPFGMHDGRRHRVVGAQVHHQSLPVLLERAARAVQWVVVAAAEGAEAAFAINTDLIKAALQ